MVSWEPRGPPVASGSLSRGLRERSESPGWPPGGLVSLLGLWEPPGRRALGGSCDVGRSWVAFEPPEPASGKLPRKKLPAQLATMSVPTWLAAMAPTPGMQRCTRLAEPRRNPRANHPNKPRPKHRPYIVLRFLQPGNTDARSAQPTKGHKCVGHVLVSKNATPEGIKQRYSARVWSVYLLCFSATHRHKRTQLNKRTSMRNDAATNLRVAFFIP